MPTQEEDPDLDSSWTRKRLRPERIEGPKRRDDNPVQAPLVSSNSGRARKRKAAETSRSSQTAQRIDDDPIHSMARRIGHSDRIGEMQQMIHELQSGADQALTPAQLTSDAAVPPSKEDLAHLLHIVPTVA